MKSPNSLTAAALALTIAAGAGTAAAQETGPQTPVGQGQPTEQPLPNGEIQPTGPGVKPDQSEGVLLSAAVRNKPIFIPNEKLKGSRMDNPTAATNYLASRALLQVLSAKKQGATSWEVTVSPHQTGSNKQAKAGNIGPNRDTNLVEQAIEDMAEQKGLDLDVKQTRARITPFSQDSRFRSALRFMETIDDKNGDPIDQARVLRIMNQGPKVGRATLNGLSPHLGNGIYTIAKEKASGVDIQVSYVIEGNQPNNPNPQPETANPDDGLPKGEIQPVGEPTQPH